MIPSVQMSPYGHETTPNEGTILFVSTPTTLLTSRPNCAAGVNVTLATEAGRQLKKLRGKHELQKQTKNYLYFLDKFFVKKFSVTFSEFIIQHFAICDITY